MADVEKIVDIVESYVRARIDDKYESGSLCACHIFESLYKAFDRYPPTTGEIFNAMESWDMKRFLGES